MDRMKTLLTYALLIIVFFIVSVFLENGLITTMYKNVITEFNGDYKNEELSVENMEVKASNVNGYMSFNLINTTSNFIDKCYLKINLYNKQNLLADTEYMEILEMQPGETKNINIKIKANNIKGCKISLEENIPDKTNIINVFGWEIDLTNVFGLGIDLSNTTLFGTKLTDIFDFKNIKATGSSFWKWLVLFTANIPWWGYFFGLLFYVGIL